MRPISAKQAVRMAAAACFTVGAGATQALTVTQADIQSYLTQRLRARVHIELAPGEAPPNYVGLASADDAARFGLPAQTQMNLSVRTVPAAGGIDVFVESKTPVSEPMFTVLLDVHSGPLRTLREFTVLLDPPPVETMMADAAPASVPAPVPVASPAAAPAAAAAVVSNADNDRPAPKKARHGSGHSRAGARAEHTQAFDWTPPPGPASSDETYGPVAPGETLSHIAQIYRPSPTLSLSAVVAKLVAANPEVTLGRNDFLPAGAILKIPADIAPYKNAPWSGMSASMWKKKTSGGQPTLAGYRKSAVGTAQRFQLAFALDSLHADPSLAQASMSAAPEPWVAKAPAPSPAPENTIAETTPAVRPREVEEATPASTADPNLATAAPPPPTAAPVAAEQHAEAVAPMPASPRPRPALEKTSVVAKHAAAQSELENSGAGDKENLRGLAAFAAVLAALAAGLIGWGRRKEMANRARPAVMVAPTVALLSKDAAAAGATAKTASAVVKPEISPDERVVLLKQAYAARGKRFRDVLSAS
jgi:Tfp pilus assembly protein FimV